MKLLKRILTLAGVLLLTFSMAGCTILDDYVKKSVSSAAEGSIQDSEEYRQYLEYQADGLLDENGTYPSPQMEETAAPVSMAGKVKITIAVNSLLNCSFYTNETTKTPIAVSEIYLAPGESLFVARVSTVNNRSNLYAFSRFRIWEYDVEGCRSTTPFDEVSVESGLLLTVPEDFSGSGFSVEPLGVYTDRHITASAYYVDGSSTRQTLNGGAWEVNGKSFTDSVDISPVEPYTIVYDYSSYKDDYYFVSSSPDCWYSKTCDHAVIFQEASSTEENTDFFVCMHAFAALTIYNKCVTEMGVWVNNVVEQIPFINNSGKSIVSSIARNGEVITPINVDDTEFKIQNLCVGDVISIKIGKDYKLIGNAVNVGTPVPLGIDAENGYEYTIIVPDTNESISVSITGRNSDSLGTYQGYDVSNADLILCYSDGTNVQIGDELPENSEKITVILEPYNGFYVEGHNADGYRYEKTMRYSEFEKTASTLLSEHPAICLITFNVGFNDEAGACLYKLDGEDVTDATVCACEGQVLTIEYTTAEGWKLIRDGWVSENWSKLWGTESITKDMIITNDWNGTTVNRETFGIEVAEG